MGQKHGRYPSKMDIVLVFLSVRSFREFMAQWLMGGDGELELTENSINCVVRMTLWNCASLSRLRWPGHVTHQDGDDISRRFLLSKPEGKRPRGRLRLRWEDGVKEDAAKLERRNWTVVALNREGWRKLLKEAEAHPGLCRWRDRKRYFISCVTTTLTQ